MSRIGHVNVKGVTIFVTRSPSDAPYDWCAIYDLGTRKLRSCARTYGKLVDIVERDVDEHRASAGPRSGKLPAGDAMASSARMTEDRVVLMKSGVSHSRSKVAARVGTVVRFKDGYGTDYVITRIHQDGRIAVKLAYYDSQESWQDPSDMVAMEYGVLEGRTRAARRSGRSRTSLRLRKGMVFRRRHDGYVFRVESTGHDGAGGLLQCVNATKVYGWFWSDEIERDFERMPA